MVNTVAYFDELLNQDVNISLKKINNLYKIKLVDGTIFSSDGNQSIVEGALFHGVFLEHSCLNGRCSSCKFKVLSGETITTSEETPLSESEKSEGFILTCVRKPISDIVLDAEDLSQYGFASTVTIPAKINSIIPLTEDILQVGLRVPPNQKVNFLEGQYLNVIWKGIKRSYSIASHRSSTEIQLIIKNYTGGEMSKYWFELAKVNDLLRLEIPKGTFFLRNHVHKNTLVFLATGTGIAPIKAMLEAPENQAKFQEFKKIVVFWGMREEKNLFWKPQNKAVEFVPVLSGTSQPKKYIQDRIQEYDLDWTHSVVYACGSNDMIESAKQTSIQLGLNPNHFYSDAFVASN